MKSRFIFILASLFLNDTPIFSQTKLDSLSNRITELEITRNVYGRFFDSLEGMLTAYLAIFTLLSVLLLGFQVWVARNEKKSSEEMRKSLADTVREQDKSNQALLKSFGRNIDQTTKFISSYTSLVGIQKDADAINEKMKKFLGDEEARREKLQKKQEEKNGQAMRLVKSVFEADFGSTYFLIYDLQKFNDFYVEMSALFTAMELDESSEKNWNADTYLLMGLNQLLGGQSKDAEKYLAKATRRVEGFIKSPPEHTSIIFPEKELAAEYGEIEGWNKLLRSKCAFYSGINHYRLGRFLAAKSEFEKAVEYSPNEIEPSFWFYQSCYWGEDFKNFTDSMQKMETLANLIEKDSKSEERVKKMLIARLYKKIGDFYLPSDVDARYASEKDNERSSKFYQKAFSLIQEVSKGNLENIPSGYAQIVPMVYFAHADALRKGSEPLEQLFVEIENLCEQVVLEIQSPETKYMLYYILAYCQYHLKKNREAGFNIAHALIEFDRFCSNPDYYGYSPIHNAMLRSQEIKKELNEFKTKLFIRN